jgi:hypothetical protein
MWNLWYVMMEQDNGNKNSNLNLPQVQNDLQVRGITRVKQVVGKQA